MEVIVRGSSLKDKSGERIWFPKDGRPYYDQGLRREFKTPMEKKVFMDTHNIISNGSMDMDNKKLRAVSKELCEIDKKRAKQRDIANKDLGIR